MASKIKHVVADAGAFIRNAPLQDIAENIYTIPEVIAESCDRATRRRLKTLPLDIKFKEPSGDSVLIITAFAKKTGDYSSLSAVDLKVLALAYDLEKQFKGVAHLRREPAKNYKEGEALPSSLIGEASLDDEDSENEDFYDAQQTPDGNTDDEGEDGMEEDANSVQNVPEKELEIASHSDNATEGAESKEETSGTADGIADNVQEIDEMGDEDVEEEDEEEDDDDEGWITPANIVDVKRSMGVDTVADSQICVGCLTTDFAMQNILIQMGLHVLSVDGMLIKRAKSYVLRCYGCMRITKDTSKKFCPHCGNQTLKRLSTTIEEDGTVRYWLAKNFTIRTRGTKFSLPRPQGGKHAINPRLCADQPSPHQRQSKKALQRVDILSDDIVSGSSPFRVNDVTSRSAQLGINNRHGQPHWAKRNPNESRRKGTSRRKVK